MDTIKGIEQIMTRLEADTVIIELEHRISRRTNKLSYYQNGAETENQYNQSYILFVGAFQCKKSLSLSLNKNRGKKTKEIIMQSGII